MVKPPSAIKVAFEKMAKGMVNLTTAQCLKLTEYTKKKMAEH